jgi:hypothetical protein
MYPVYPPFNTYKEALSFYKIQNETMYLNVVDHVSSLERIIQGGNVVYLVGIGPLSTPGRPAGNQQYGSQFKILQYASKLQRQFPLFHKKNDTKIYFMGMYVLDAMQKKMAPSGFSYFEYRMLRVSGSYSAMLPIVG